MAALIRADFSQAAVGLTLSAQKKNLQALHDWLVNEQAMPTSERVVALTNYQQGRFGRMPTHILIVTTGRLAYTHDGGLRSIPLGDIDTSRIGLNTGLASGEITIALRAGETLTFRRGMTIAMSEVAHALTNHTPTPAAPPIPAPTQAPAAPTRAPANSTGTPPPPGTTPDGPSLEERTYRHHGPGVYQYETPQTSPCPVQITGGSPGSAFSVWALGLDLEKSELLVNTAGTYQGTRILANRGPVRALQFDTPGPWSIAGLAPQELPVLDRPLTGDGDAAIMARADLTNLDTGIIAAIEIHGGGAATLWAYGTDTSLLVNQIAPFVGTVVIPPGTQFLTIDAEGPWAVTPQ